ncbi:MAG: hypothetical protein WBA07_15280 [Rivularia sp. (in: cyanobacteria)]
MNKSLRLKVISSLILQLGITLVLSSCQQLDRAESESTQVNQNTQREIKLVIENYIQTEKFIKDFFSWTSINGKVFCSYHYLGADQKNKNTINAYLWLLCDEYNSKLKTGSGTRVPIVTMLKKQVNNYQVIDHRYPGNGSFYQQDIKKLFPADIRSQIFRFNSEQPKIINNLNRENIRKAEAYFNKM